MPDDRSSSFGVVAIGRNEGERLKQCLRSVSGAAKVIYVDSGSSDDSAACAHEFGVEVLELDLSNPFTAARARNAGFRHLRKIAPDLQFVQFVDGDCELNGSWPAAAITFMHSHEQVCAVLGRLRERYPDRSIYNRMCDREWDIPIGEVPACGGIVMMRIDAFEAAGGYRDELIAGEEPELCIRLRAAGWKIWRLNHEMAWHDAAMLHFRQWWRRQLRSGYAFAQGAHLHGDLDERHWVWESRRAQLWGFGFPLLLASALIVLGWWGGLLFLVYPLQILRRINRMPGRWPTQLQFAFFEQLSRFPEAVGQLKFARDRLLRVHGHLIEYK
ncbi:MAG TPA: glycosyltransferase family 2 protein [Pseudolabrys sp.]|nr:glycosyltransferase family 2 protein [Pseudolabrys sp.]